MDDMRVTSFTEKPRGDGGCINGGFFIMLPKVLALIANGEWISASRRIVSAVQKRTQDFSLFRSKLRPMNPRIHNTKPSITEKKIANGSEQFVTAVPKSKIAPCK